ncbi:hypothetical protein ABZ349_29665 [Streptomyces niveus]|uniref:hypothetical protein n=1 Tax=Streptomyces niveus TaxID=193462 RepID=UPI0033F67F52
MASPPPSTDRICSDAAGTPPYEEWRKEGLFRTPVQVAVLEILRDSYALRIRFNVDQPLGDAAAVVGHVLTHRVNFSLGDEPTLNRFDDAVRALALARGPVGSADLVTVLGLSSQTHGRRGRSGCTGTTRIKVPSAPLPRCDRGVVRSGA